MAIAELLPCLDLEDLIKFYQLNRYCKSLMTPGEECCLRFEILFNRQPSQFRHAPDDW